MTVKPDGTSQRPNRGRVAIALCTAGAVAVALGGNLLGAGAGEAPVPGETVAAPPTQVAAEPQAHEDEETRPGTSSGADERPAVAAAEKPVSDPKRPGTATPGSDAAAPEEPASDEAAGRPAAPPAQPAQPASPADPPASAPAPARPSAAAPAPSTAAPLPLSGFAGPAERPARRAAKRCSTHNSKSQVEGKPMAPAGACRSTPLRRPQTARTVAPHRGAQRDSAPAVELRNAEGVPTLANPTTSLALPGPVAIGVPNFFIDKFRIPPFLLPIYQAAGIQYGIRWEILAAINEIETDYGRNLNISSAGALGWMQFMPATWRQYGVDANRDGRKDPFNPVDAIFAAARYLRAAGAHEDLRKAIFAYNHADWYVESVLMRARLIGGMPADLVGSLSGLTQGHFPVFARARYADDLGERISERRSAVGRNVANPVESSATRRGIDIFAAAGSPVIAVQDGMIVGVGESRRLGRYVKLRDVYGNTYTYAHLKKVAAHVPVPKRRTQSRASIARELKLPKADPRPKRPATAGRRTKRLALPARAPGSTAMPAADDGGVRKERLFANPGRRQAFASGGARQILDGETELSAGASLKHYFSGVYGLDPADVALQRLVIGRRVIAGTILGRIGRTSPRQAPRLHFEIRPAGRGAPRIDPKPILDGWKLLETTAIYRVRGRNALLGGARASIGQIMLMGKPALQRRVLANPRIEVYSCGRRDIAAGIVDRRVLATLEFLAASGLKPTVTSLRCGHSFYTKSGNVSAHSSGNAVDIAKINGVPILGNQGEGSITDIAVRRLLTLQGTVKPNQIISLMTYQGTDNTLAMGDHHDHIHVGFQPQYKEGSPQSSRVDAVLKPSQWIKLIDRLGRIDNPRVAAKPSRYAIRVPVPRASAPHRGE